MLFSRSRRPDRAIASVTLACLDNTGRRTELLIALDRQRLVLAQPYGVAIVLTPLQAGRLRAAIRDLVLSAEARDDRR
jgi:hypothetical protein